MSPPVVFITGIVALLILGKLLFSSISSTSTPISQNQDVFQKTNLKESSDFTAVTKNFLELQYFLDESVSFDRSKLNGHMGWLDTMCMYFWNVARDPTIKNICEVGFGCGHSSTLFLSANPSAKMLSFDLFPTSESDIESKSEMSSFRSTLWKFQKAGQDYINRRFPNRFQAIAGDSKIMIPKFLATHPGHKCDLIYIDGSHDRERTIIDGKNFKLYAHADTVVLFDDLEYSPVAQAVDTLVQSQVIHPPIECIEGEKLINKLFGPPALKALHSGKKFCRSKYVF